MDGSAIADIDEHTYDGHGPPNRRDSPAAEDVRFLIEANVRDNYATSPAESVHVLDTTALLDSGITFWSAGNAGTAEVLAIGAIKLLSATSGEVKSMRTAEAAHGRGIARKLLHTIMLDCRQRGVREPFLETGVEDSFAPARSLYARLGFVRTGPFAEYTDDPNTVFLRRSTS